MLAARCRWRRTLAAAFRYVAAAAMPGASALVCQVFFFVDAVFLLLSFFSYQFSLLSVWFFTAVYWLFTFSARHAGFRLAFFSSPDIFRHAAFRHFHTLRSAIAAILLYGFSFSRLFRPLSLILLCIIDTILLLFIFRLFHWLFADTLLIVCFAIIICRAMLPPDIFISSFIITIFILLFSVFRHYYRPPFFAPLLFFSAATGFSHYIVAAIDIGHCHICHFHFHFSRFSPFVTIA